MGEGGPGRVPLIFEDGDYEHHDRTRLNWTVNNLFEAAHDYEIIEDIYSYKFHVNGREVETKFYLEELDRRYEPDIKAFYYFIIEEDGVNQLVLSREFIEAYIEASSKHAKLTDELNNFIDQLNRIYSAEFDNLTEAKVDSLFYIDPSLVDQIGLELKKRYTVYSHYQSTNVFWIEESTDLGCHAARFLRSESPYCCGYYVQASIATFYDVLHRA